MHWPITILGDYMKRLCLVLVAVILIVLSVPLSGQAITVTSPVAGENWLISSSRTITWTEDGYSGNVRIQLFRSGTLVGTIADSVSASSRFLAWDVGELVSGTVTEANDFTIRVAETGSGNFGQSPQFSITLPVSNRPLLRIEGLDAGRYVLNQQVPFSVCYSNLPEGTAVTLELYKDNTRRANRVGVYVTRTTLRRDGRTRFTWLAGTYIDGTAPAGDNYIMVVSTEDRSLSYSTPIRFSLVEPASIRISSPLQPLTATHLFPLSWNARNIAGELVINVLRESGGAFTIATSVDPGGSFGTFQWTVGRLANPDSRFPVTEGQRFSFQIGGRGTDGQVIISDSRRFEIITPALAITEPHWGERLIRGDNKTIRWNAPDLQGMVHIEAWYRRAPSESFRKYKRIGESVPNLGHYSWIVFKPHNSSVTEMYGPPTEAGSAWVIRIISQRCPWLYAVGPQFTVRED